MCHPAPDHLLWSRPDVIKDTVRDWSFMKESIGKGKKIQQNTNPGSLRGPLTDSEMQKVANFYLKIGKAPGPDNIQAELIKTMPPEQLRVIKLWLNEVLPEGKSSPTSSTNVSQKWSKMHIYCHRHRAAFVKTKARTSMDANCMG